MYQETISNGKYFRTHIAFEHTCVVYFFVFEIRYQAFSSLCKFSIVELHLQTRSLIYYCYVCKISDCNNVIGSSASVFAMRSFELRWLSTLPFYVPIHITFLLNTLKHLGHVAFSPDCCFIPRVA